MNSESNEKNSDLAKTICLICSVVTLITIILGLIYKNPFIIIIGFLPAAIYEAIRTEGFYTKSGSIAIMILVVLEIFAIRGVLKFNLANFFQSSEIYFAGYFLPLGELSLVFPVLAAIISLVLFIRTYGIYTKWLSILLLLSSIALAYVVNKDILFDLIKNTRYYY